jgi:two-component system sensor histidine kinase QseC
MNSIRHRLTRDVLAISALLLGGSVAALYLAARAELVEQFDAALQAKALALGAIFGEDEGRVHLNFANNFLRAAADGKPLDFFELWDAAGARLARSPALGEADLPRRTGSPGRPAIWNLVLPDGRAGRAIGVGFTPPPGEAQLVVASSREKLDEALAELLGIGGACGALLLAAVFVAVPRVLRRGLAPLDRLAGQVAAIDAGSLAARFPAGGLPAELQPICARLNELLARLEASFERERRFSADLAHELRTPLAELRSLAECSLKWPETRDGATDRDTLAIARQMEALVTQMLALARGEHGHVAATREPVALEALVREAWRPFAARAEARGLRASIALVPVTAAADPVLLRSVLANLFDNAVDHAPPGGEIGIALESGARGATIRVANAAPDLAPADLEKLFDRFWRKEAARSGGQHTGLGLALARTFAAATGWSLTAALDGKRLVFTLAVAEPDNPPSRSKLAPTAAPA